MMLEVVVDDPEHHVRVTRLREGLFMSVELVLEAHRSPGVERCPAHEDQVLPHATQRGARIVHAVRIATLRLLESLLQLKCLSTDVANSCRIGSSGAIETMY